MAPKPRGKQPDFVFLSYAPDQNRTSQALQETQRRAHAARRSHALARQRRGIVETSSSEGGSSSNSPESTKNSPPKEPSANSIVVPQYVEDIEVVENTYVGSDLPASIPTESSQAVSPRMLLGQGTIDPFDAVAAKDLPPYVWKVLDLGE